MKRRVFLGALLAAIVIVSGCRSAPGEVVRRSEFDNLSGRVANLEVSVRTLQNRHPDLATTVSGGNQTATRGTAVSTNRKGPSSGEKSDYQRGQSYLKQKKYDQAATVFGQMLVDYPSGQLAPNAGYWLGESYYAAGRFQEAIIAFQNTADKYSYSDKAPDALLKLSCSLDHVNDGPKAMAVMDILLTKHPESEAARKVKSGGGCFKY